MSKVTFITGNQDKADYIGRLLGIDMDHMKLDLDEIQAKTVQEVVEHKVRQAYDIARKPVLVDDFGVGLTALNGLPGPFLKFFIEQPDGLEKFCRMLDGFEDRSATATCVMGYYDGRRLELFTSNLEGVIVDHPRGEGGYGGDPTFAPHGYGGRTRAELTPEEYDEVYLRVRPFTQVREFFQSIGIN